MTSVVPRWILERNGSRESVLARQTQPVII
jgi:hypothetical protein